MVQAVIFDMDGTLIDSERIGWEAWYRVNDRLGTDIDDELIARFIGRTRADVTAFLVERLGSRELGERAFNVHTEVLHELEATELVAKPGAREALRALRERGVYCGVATSSHRPVAERNLAYVGLIDFFQHITCGEETANGKPAPDIYLLAAERAGARPEECAVVEDSPNGVRSGHAAGMRVALVPDLVQPDEEIRSKSTWVLESLNELVAALDA